MTDETPTPENAAPPTNEPSVPSDVSEMLALAVGKLGPLADRVSGMVSEVENGALRDFKALERHLIAYHGLDPNWRERTPP